MADTGRSDDGTDEGPSLEMPSFSLRRKKKAAPPEDVAPEPEQIPITEPGPTPEPTSDTTPDPTPESQSEPEPTSEPTSDRIPDSDPQPTAQPEPRAEPKPEPRPEPTPDPIPEPEPTPEPAYEPPTAITREPEPAYEPPTAVVPAVEGDEPKEPARREPREFPLSGLPAAAATGLVVGGLAVLFWWLATRGCEAVRGTSSCGGGPGFLILLVVLALLAVAGAWVLDLFGEPEHGSTSLLAVGIMAVLVMVFLLGSLDEPWAAIAVPVTAVIGYCVSWWVTHAVVGDEAPQEPAESHDVR